MSSIGFVDKFYTQITEAITAAATTVYIPDPDYKEILNLDEDYVYVLLRDAEDREIVIIDVSASSKSGGLTVARGQESTVAKVWPRGTTMVRALTAAIAGTFLQKAYYRSIGYDPNGAIAPAFAGEKLLQSTDNAASTRWWISKNATDKSWLPLTKTTDPGGGGGGSGDTAILNVIWTMEEWNEAETITYDDSFYGYDGEVGSYSGGGLVAKDTSVFKVGTASARLDVNGDKSVYLAGGSTSSCSHAYTGLDTTLAGWIYLPGSISPGNAFTMDMTLTACPFVSGAPSIGYSIGAWYIPSAWYIVIYYSSAISYTYGIAGSFTLGGWTHLAAVLDASATNAYVYENGSLIYTLDVSSIYQDMTGFAAIGVSNVSNDIIPTGTDLYCYYDDVRSYNYALTAAEIAALPGM